MNFSVFLVDFEDRQRVEADNATHALGTSFFGVPGSYTICWGERGDVPGRQLLFSEEVLEQQLYNFGCTNLAVPVYLRVFWYF